MLIRNETTTDIQAISELHYSAFKGHPQHEPGAEPTEHLLVDRLREAGVLVLSLVAEDDGAVAGHVAMSPASIGETGGWFLLGPVGVLPARQGEGIGSALIREALELMQTRNAAGIVLVGDPAYYARFGFRSHDALTYQGVPQQYVLALPFDQSTPSGELTHHEAFF